MKVKVAMVADIIAKMKLEDPGKWFRGLELAGMDVTGY